MYQHSVLLGLLIVHGALAADGDSREGKNLHMVVDFMTELMNLQGKAVDNRTAMGMINLSETDKLKKEVHHYLNGRFYQLITEIPADISIAVTNIYDTIAKKNAFDYTILVGFVLGAALDTAAEFIIEERSIWDISGNIDGYFLYGFLWFYAFGFAGPYFLGLENPVQDCSAVDFVQAITENNLSLEQMNTMTPSELMIQMAKIRFDVDQGLFCVLSKVSRFSEAAIVSRKIDEMYDICNVVQQIGSIPAGKDEVGPELTAEEIANLFKSIANVDKELDELWRNFESQVREAYDYTFARQLNDNYFKAIIGVPNLLGMIFGVLFLVESTSLDDLPPISDIPEVIFEDYKELLQGQASNSFLVGDILAIIAIQCWGYSYFAPWLLTFIEPDPGCGVNEFNDIIREYREFSNLTTLFGSSEDILAGNVVFSKETYPAYTGYRLRRFIKELKVALHCLVYRTEKSSYNLAFSIDTWLDLALYRIDLTQSLIQSAG